MNTPNILFLFPDQWRGDWLGCADSGVPVRTPVLDALAARGFRARHCRSNSPLCSPARACLSLGVRYADCGVPNNKHDTAQGRTTIWQLLRSAGYRVGTCGKNDLHKGSSRYTRQGWQPLLGRYGFTEAVEQTGKWDTIEQISKGLPEAYSTFLRAEQQADAYSEEMNARRQRSSADGIAPNPTALPEYTHTDAFCGQQALSLLDGFPQHQPWALWVNFPGPHEPFDPPLSWAKRYDGVSFPAPIEPGEGGDDHQQLRRNYAASCSFIDHWIGRLLDRVEQRGELDNTLVIVSSDHGEALGDHGRWGKSTWFEGSVHVPLIVAGPGFTPGTVSDAPVELIDVGATCLAAAGIEIPEHMDARPLQPAMAGAEHRAYQHMALKDWKSCCDGRYKAVECAGERFGFDLKNDPDETRVLPASDLPTSLWQAIEQESSA